MRRAAPWIWVTIASIVFTLAVFGVQRRSDNARQTAAKLVVMAQRKQNAMVRAAQIAACGRGTVLRTQINAIEANVRADQDALITFLRTAIVARKAAGKPLDLAAVKKYQPALKKLLAAPSFRAVDQPNCVQAVDHPNAVVASPKHR